jgi:hypothetical protein
VKKGFGVVKNSKSPVHNHVVRAGFISCEFSLRKVTRCSLQSMIQHAAQRRETRQPPLLRIKPTECVKNRPEAARRPRASRHQQARLKLISILWKFNPTR